MYTQSIDSWLKQCIRINYLIKWRQAPRLNLFEWSNRSKGAYTDGLSLKVKREPTAVWWKHITLSGRRVAVIATTHRSAENGRTSLGIPCHNTRAEIQFSSFSTEFAYTLNTVPHAEYSRDSILELQESSIKWRRFYIFDSAIGSRFLISSGTYRTSIPWQILPAKGVSTEATKTFFTAWSKRLHPVKTHSAHDPAEVFSQQMVLPLIHVVLLYLLEHKSWSNHWQGGWGGTN